MMDSGETAIRVFPISASPNPCFSIRLRYPLTSLTVNTSATELSRVSETRMWMKRSFRIDACFSFSFVGSVANRSSNGRMVDGESSFPLFQWSSTCVSFNRLEPHATQRLGVFAETSPAWTYPHLSHFHDDNLLFRFWGCSRIKDVHHMWERRYGR